ncbi:histone-like nucleoid-structuring protein Lsr2 [Amycolatopsis sp. H20-H5]|uniref:histone-like nucleoid-structuring protein Lsr2 n=1 Tax=Amycolatopsis sp. H20-H5 TaxID=3046309 RepID=UPI002DB84A9E|nr:Lsr2 family protein [Amycolatopsis sp. H20-H5]MEC3981615.1 Lsr2 family protein [Amycolatopsis sp. H20-H5]
MERRFLTFPTDDLDGSPATESIGFSLDGREYRVDLSERNAHRLRETLAPYVDRGRRTGGRKEPHRLGKEIRVLARRNGYSVVRQGRLPIAVVSAYDNRRWGAAEDYQD